MHWDQQAVKRTLDQLRKHIIVKISGGKGDSATSDDKQLSKTGHQSDDTFLHPPGRSS